MAEQHKKKESVDNQETVREKLRRFFPSLPYSVGEYRLSTSTQLKSNIFSENKELLDECPTENDSNSFFHAAFGERQLLDNHYCYRDSRAPLRRMGLSTFLTYYQNKPKPAPLRNALQKSFELHGWSVDNKNDYKKFVEVIEEGRQIILNDLPILAALENVKIVLNNKKENVRQVIEPNMELLDGYPLTKRKPPETVIVGYKGSVFHKVVPRDSESGNEIETPPAPGFWNIISLVDILLLNGLRKHKDWGIGFNIHPNNNYFGDVVFKVEPKQNYVFFQVEWRTTSIEPNHFFDIKDSAFNLVRSFLAYQSLIKKYYTANIVLCTNVDIKFGYLQNYMRRHLVKDDLLYIEGKINYCYTFDEDFLLVFMRKLQNYDSAEAKRYREDKVSVGIFLQNLKLITLYKGNNLEEEIEDQVVAVGLIDRNNSADYVRQLNKKIKEWYDNVDKTSPYLRLLETKAIFSELKNNTILEQLRTKKIEFKKHDFLVNVKKRLLHIVADTNPNLSLLRVVNSLGNDVSKTLFCNTSETIFSQKLMIEALEHPRYSNLVIYPDTRKQWIPTLQEKIEKVLKDFKDKKVILIAAGDDELARCLKTGNEEIFQVVSDDIKLTDFTDRSQQELLEKALQLNLQT